MGHDDLYFDERQMDHFDLYNALLAIGTNIP